MSAVSAAFSVFECVAHEIEQRHRDHAERRVDGVCFAPRLNLARVLPNTKTTAAMAPVWITVMRDQAKTGKTPGPWAEGVLAPSFGMPRASSA
jgi:hypothetical protein